MWVGVRARVYVCVCVCVHVYVCVCVELLSHSSADFIIMYHYVYR